MAETDLSTTEYDVAAKPDPNGSRPLPDVISVTIGPVVFRPRDIEDLMDETGLSLDAIQEKYAVRLQVWLALRKAGYTPTWDEARDVGVEFGEAAPDPTGGGTTTPSPRSAGSGGAPPATSTP